MAELVRNRIADPQMVQECVADMGYVADRYLAIEVGVSGSDERVTVASPASPGAVRGAVEKTLRGLGLTAIPG